MFQPSEELARMTVAAQREPPDVPLIAALMAEDVTTPGLRRIDVTSRYVPLYDRQINLEVVRDALTERFFGLLGTLVRRHASLHPDTKKLLLISEQQQFEPVVCKAVSDRLDLAEAKAADVLHQLACEFYDWARHHPQEREEAGLELDNDQLFLRCP
jgi:hypothetical protein